MRAQTSLDFTIENCKPRGWCDLRFFKDAENQGSGLVSAVRKFFVDESNNETADQQKRLAATLLPLQTRGVR
jgi:hypothetical protein